MATQISGQDIRLGEIDSSLLKRDANSLAKVSEDKLEIFNGNVILKSALTAQGSGVYIDSPSLRENGKNISSIYAKLEGSSLTGDITWEIKADQQSRGLIWSGLSDLHKIFVEEDSAATGGELTRLVIQSGDDGDSDYTVFRNVSGTTSTDVLEIHNTYAKINKELRMSGNKITSLATPASSADASTKGYVDSKVSSHAGGAASTSVLGHVKFDTTAPPLISSSSSTGSASTVARRDHTHGHGTFSSGDYHTLYYKKAGDTMSGALNMNGSSINSAKTVNIKAPGLGCGLVWNETAAGWKIDVAPAARGSSADGDLHLYGTANSIILHRPVVAKSTLVTSSSLTVGSNLTVNGTGTSSFSGNATFASKVGIGTQSPGAPLEVVGLSTHGGKDISVIVDSGGTNASRIKFVSSGSPSKQSAIGFSRNGSGDFAVLTSTDGASSWAQPFVVTSIGRVGIGTTSPSNKLTISGGHDSSIVRIHADNGSYAPGNLYLWASEPGKHYDASGIGNNWRYDSGWGRQDTTTGASYIELASNEINLRTVTSAEVDNIGISINNGYTGLGLKNPTQRLDVNGAIAINGTIVVDKDRSITAPILNTDTIKSTSTISILNGGAAQGIKIGNLLISNVYADSTKVPTNGMYCKGNIYTNGHIRNTAGTTTKTFAAGTNTLSQTFTHNYGSTSYVVVLTSSSPTRHHYYANKSANTVDICIDDIPTEDITIDVLVIGT